MVWKTVRPFLIGGLSASSATCCIRPIDMVKVRIQLQSGKVNANPVNIAATMLRTEGVTIFYRGLSAAVFRQLTYGMTRLGVFRTLTNRYTPAGKTAADIDFLTKVGCSLTAGGIGALVGTPAEVALIRMQADTVCPVAERRGYKNVVDALLRIGREEGLNGFFTGATTCHLVGQMFQGKLPLAGVSRVSFPKNCVSVTRHHTAGLEKAPDVCLGLVVCQVHADLLDHAIKEDQHLLVGEPVEGSSQAAHAGSEGEVGVGESRADQVGGVGRHVASLVVTVDCEVKSHELGEERVLVANHLAEVG